MTTDFSAAARAAFPGVPVSLDDTHLSVQVGGVCLQVDDETRRNGGKPRYVWRVWGEVGEHTTGEGSDLAATFAAARSAAVVKARDTRVDADEAAARADRALAAFA